MYNKKYYREYYKKTKGQDRLLVDIKSVIRWRRVLVEFMDGEMFHEISIDKQIKVQKELKDIDSWLEKYKSLQFK